MLSSAAIDQVYASSRTVVVLGLSDLSQISPCSPPTTIGVESLDGNQSVLFKSVAAMAWEGLAEYCRLHFALTPHLELSVLIATNDRLGYTRLNTWDPEQQTLAKLLGTVTPIPLPDEVNVNALLSQAVSCMSEAQQPIATSGEASSSLRTSPRNCCRLVCLLDHPVSTTPHFISTTSDASPVDVGVRIHEEVLASNARENVALPVHSCQVDLIRLVSSDAELSSIPQAKASVRQVSRRVGVQTHCVSSASLREVFVDLAVDHLNLACVTVCGVPMRRPSQPKFASNLQNIEFFFPVLRDHPPITTNWVHPLGQSKWRSEPTRFVSAEWEPAEKRLNPTALPTKSVHRVAPVLTDSPASRTLMSFVRSGKPVVLGSRDPLRAAPHRKTGFDNTWGVFVEHAGDVFLHRLHPSLDLAEIPYLSNGGLKPLRDLRLRDMTTLIHESRLRPATTRRARIQPFVQLPTNPAVTTIIHVERHTRMFPLLQNKTLLHGPQCDDLRLLLDPLKALLLDPGVPPPNSLETAIQLLGRLEQLSRNNESRLFPHLSHQPAKRFAAYEQLWRDIIQFVECYPKHHSYRQLRTTVYRCALQSAVDVIGSEGANAAAVDSAAASAAGSAANPNAVSQTAGENAVDSTAVDLSWRAREKVMADRYSSLGQAINTMDSTHQTSAATTAGSTSGGGGGGGASSICSASDSSASTAISGGGGEGSALSPADEQALIRRQAALVSRELAAQEEAVWPDKVWPRKRKAAHQSTESMVASVLEWARDSTARRCESRIQQRVARARAL